MILDPLSLLFWVAAASGSLLYLSAAVSAMDVAANWAPQRTDSEQLRREHRAQTGSLLSRGALGCLAAAGVVWLVGLALGWHRIVPGAMCGTGVLQAMAPFGQRSLLFWGLALVLLYAWQTLDGLNRRDPLGPLTADNARLLLTAAPFWLLGLIATWQASTAVDAADPVSCCAAVYDQVFRQSAPSGLSPTVVNTALWGSLLGGATLTGLAIHAAGYQRRSTDTAAAVLALLWAVLSAVAVKHVWSSYYYQVLSHPCPWCLFLPAYKGAGFVLFGCLALAVLEGAALLAAHSVYQRHAGLRAAADDRCRRAARRVLVATCGHLLLALVPAIRWRLSTGMWLGGQHLF